MGHRSLWAAFAAFVLLLAPGPKASAATSFSFSLRIGDPYIGPSLAFYEQPDVVLIPGTRVYYIDDYDYDLYRYGNYWYYCWNGGWYRSVDYDGPFYFIGYQSVPYAIRYIPARYKHHWRSYRGDAYSHYSAGRYYPSNPGSYTYYRTRYENRYPQSRSQFSVQENRYRQRQQPVQYRQERAPQREQYRQQPVQQRQQRAREQVRQQQPPQREQVRQQDQGRQRQQEGRQNQGKRGKGNQKGQEENRGQGGGHGRGHGN